MRLTFVYDPICVPLFAFYDDSEDIVPLSPGTSSYVHLSACVSSTFHWENWWQDKSCDYLWLV